MTQVAGRAGRGDERGRVVIQTYEPDNYALTNAVRNDFQGFFREETRIRSFLEYPPFGDMIMVNFTSDDEEDIAFIKEQIERTETDVSKFLFAMGKKFNREVKSIDDMKGKTYKDKNNGKTYRELSYAKARINDKAKENN